MKRPLTDRELAGILTLLFSAAFSFFVFSLVLP